MSNLVVSGLALHESCVTLTLTPLRDATAGSRRRLMDRMTRRWETVLHDSQQPRRVYKWKYNFIIRTMKNISFSYKHHEPAKPLLLFESSKANEAVNEFARWMSRIVPSWAESCSLSNLRRICREEIYRWRFDYKQNTSRLQTIRPSLRMGVTTLKKSTLFSRRGGRRGGIIKAQKHAQRKNRNEKIKQDRLSD